MSALDAPKHWAQVAAARFVRPPEEMSPGAIAQLLELTNMVRRARGERERTLDEAMAAQRAPATEAGSMQLARLIREAKTKAEADERALRGKEGGRNG